MDSPDRTPNDQSTFKGAPNEVSRGRDPSWGGGGGGRPPSVDKIREKSPSGVATAPMLLRRPTVPSLRGKGYMTCCCCARMFHRRRGSIPRLAWWPLIQMVLWKSSTVGAPSTRQSLRLCTCTTSILIIFEYP